MSFTCCFCRKGLVAEEVGYRTDEHAPTRDRVACEKSPTRRHEPACIAERIPVQAVMECPCGFQTGDPT
jgi:hypothetical protein